MTWSPIDVVRDMTLGHEISAFECLYALYKLTGGPNELIDGVTVFKKPWAIVFVLPGCVAADHVENRVFELYVCCIANRTIG